jgi:hypothetical protein
MGMLHQLMFELHEFGAPESPLGWISDTSLHSGYLTDRVFTQITHPYPVFQGSLFGTGIQNNLCPGVSLVNGELWVPHGRFLVIARVIFKAGSISDPVWQILATGISATLGRLINARL